MLELQIGGGYQCGNVGRGDGCYETRKITQGTILLDHPAACWSSKPVETSRISHLQRTDTLLSATRGRSSSGCTSHTSSWFNDVYHACGLRRAKMEWGGGGALLKGGSHSADFGTVDKAPCTVQCVSATPQRPAETTHTSLYDLQLICWFKSGERSRSAQTYGIRFEQKTMAMTCLSDKTSISKKNLQRAREQIVQCMGIGWMRADEEMG